VGHDDGLTKNTTNTMTTMPAISGERERQSRLDLSDVLRDLLRDLRGLRVLREQP
jgi:hypothetical protein